jgi:HD-GYP domain-containing protein (c-di-GMP phosphodiesterase class II)
MNARAKWYLVGSTLGAIACSIVLYWFDPSLPADGIAAVVLLCSLALIAEALSLLMPNSVAGSIAFIPYLAAALIVPHWIALVGVAAVRLLTELASKRTAGAPLFNVCQQVITFSCAVLLYRLVGGESLATLGHLSLPQLTLQNGLPMLSAFVLSFAINSTLVLGFIAARSNRRLIDLWKGTFLSTIGLDILASPIVFLFAWAYVKGGAFVAAALWIPVLGLRQLHKNNLDLERTNSELLELMVKSMEARDPYTSGHSRRVQQFSVAIAKGLGFSNSEVDKVSRAALLHDVGKIYEKYAPILRKPGKLSPEEWQTMQLHPTDGSELVATMSKLHDIVPAIRHHHERWDGTGYPSGLAGETIPTESRIIAFADTIDAMTSERPYRRTLSEAEVRSEMVRCRGTQFDPAMTDQVLSAPVWRLLFPPQPGESVTSPLSLISAQRAKVKQA